MSVVNQKMSEKLLCKQYWELLNQGEYGSMPLELIQGLEKALDLQPVFQTLEHVWQELTCPKNRTSISTAYCRLVSAIKGPLTLNALYYHSDNDRVPTYRDELAEMLSGRLASRYEELIAPAERAWPLIKGFVTLDQWEILTMKCGVPPYNRPHTIEEVTRDFGIKFGIKSRAAAIQIKAKALRSLRDSELAKQLWEPFFQG